MAPVTGGWRRIENHAWEGDFVMNPSDNKREFTRVSIHIEVEVASSEVVVSPAVPPGVPAFAEVI